MVNVSLGNRLKSEREKRGWSQKFVATKTGISNAVLSNYERDYRDPDTDTLKKLAELYEVETDYLLGRQVQKKDEKDIAKRLEQIRKDLESGSSDGDGLAFHGEPMSEEAIDSLMDAMELIVRQTQRINKKYIPKKYRDKETE